MYIDVKGIISAQKGSFDRARKAEKVKRDASTLQAFAAFIVVASLFTALWYFTGANIY